MVCLQQAFINAVILCFSTASAISVLSVVIVALAFRCSATSVLVSVSDLSWNRFTLFMFLTVACAINVEFSEYIFLYFPM